MKKTFLKAVAAATVVAATVALSSVAVFAEDAADPTVAVKIGETYNLSKSGLFAENKTTGPAIVSSDKRFTTNAKVDSHGPNLKPSDGSVLKLLTPSDPDGCKLVITNDGDASKDRTYNVAYATKTEHSSNDDEYTTGVIPADTIVTITGASTKTSSKILEIKVKTGAAPTEYHSVSGTVKVNGVAKADVPVIMTGSDYVTASTVTTGADGKYKFDGVGNIEEVDISIEDTDEYFGDSKTSIKPTTDLTGIDFDLKAKEKAETVDKATEVNLVEGLTAEADKEVVPDGTVIGKYFTVTDSQSGDSTLRKRTSNNAVTSLETGKAGTGNLQFTTTKDFKMTIICSSTGDSNTSEISVGDKHLSVVGGTKEPHKEFVIDNLVAGTYKISSTGGTETGRGVRVYSVKFEDIAAEDNADGATDGAVAVIKGADGTYYAVVIVSEAEAQANSALKVNAGGNSASIETVYSKVAIGDNEYTAEDLGGSAGDYVSGIKLDINNSSSATVNAETIQAKINVNKVAVA